MCQTSLPCQVWAAWAVGVTCPQLFLYSSSDVLIPPGDIERFQQQQAARGVRVSSRCWQDTPHCALLRYHPEQYREQVAGFAASLRTLK